MANPDKTILIVDDSPIIVERLKNMLEALALPVPIFHAGTSAEAQSSLHRIQPTLILLDINLPDASGIDLLKTIKKTYPAIVVIMLSNQSGDFYRNRCKSLGADYFIDKSTEFDNIPYIVLTHI